MRKFYFVLLATIIGLNVYSQNAQDVVVKLSARIEQKGIRLYWNPAASSINHVVSRKTLQGPWQEIGQVNGDSTFLDSSASRGIIYEYNIRRTLAGRNQFGYISSGWGVKADFYRGEVFLACDSGLWTRQEPKVKEFARTLVADGYTVRLFSVPSKMNHIELKDSIRKWHLINPFRHHTLLLLGKIPVPYSGNIAPDAHTEHQGAWPADVYYADFEGEWTDNINASTAQREANRNFPGDGKFDQSELYGPVSLRVGRIMLENLPVINNNSDSLYLNYFEKIKRFKMAEVDIPRRALVDDRLGALGGEYPGRTGFVNGYALVGANQTQSTNNLANVVTQEAYLFAHASSFGSYTGNGVIQSSAFASPIYSVFQGFFGSYHGDWDNQNNLLRAAIAGPGNTLTSIWAGRPQWYLHHMSMGLPIGYSTLITQSNFTNPDWRLYDPGAFAAQVHIALHGDPTLRLHPFKPISNLMVMPAADRKSCQINWMASQAVSITGYAILRSNDTLGAYSLLDTLPANTLGFTDLNPLNGLNVYQVRAIRKEEGSHGEYDNLSLGVFAAADNMQGNGELTNITSFNQAIKVYPNPIKADNTLKVSYLGNGKLELYNAMGQKVLESEHSDFSTLKLVGHATGLYLLKLHLPHKVVEEKIIIN